MVDQELFKILFIVACALLLVIILIITFLIVRKNVYYPKHFKKSYYKTVRNVVDNCDYRLINRFCFNIEENTKTMIDHIMFGDKFMYVILSRYYNGTLSGNKIDDEVIFTDKKHKKFYTENPYRYVEFIVNRFALSCGIDKKMIIGIVLTNNECKNTITYDSNSYFICTRKRFKKLIKQIESRNIGKINDEQLQNAVLLLYDMNLRKHEKLKKK